MSAPAENRGKSPSVQFVVAVDPVESSVQKGLSQSHVVPVVMPEPGVAPLTSKYSVAAFAWVANSPRPTPRLNTGSATERVPLRNCLFTFIENSLRMCALARLIVNEQRRQRHAGQ